MTISKPSAGTTLAADRPEERKSEKGPVMSIIMQKHFVTFFSLGTFFSETTAKPIDSWDVDLAVAMMTDITERHGARPYGFQFTTRGRGPDDLDSKVIAKSPMHYVGGKVETIDDVRLRADPRESILLSNMECNGWSRIWSTTEGWRCTQPLADDDVVITS